MITHKHWLPPTLVYIRGEQYLMPTWQKVPNNTKLRILNGKKKKFYLLLKKNLKLLLKPLFPHQILVYYI